jgi:hypothetical protein
MIFAGLTSGRRQLRAKNVKLTPNNKKMIKEVINCSIQKSSGQFFGLIVMSH